jgi:hypothetical protein
MRTKTKTYGASHPHETRPTTTSFWSTIGPPESPGASNLSPVATPAHNITSLLYLVSSKRLLSMVSHSASLSFGRVTSRNLLDLVVPFHVVIPYPMAVNKAPSCGLFGFLLYVAKVLVGLTSESSSTRAKSYLTVVSLNKWMVRNEVFDPFCLDT